MLNQLMSFIKKKPAKILVYKVKNTDDIVIRLTVGVIGKKNLNLRCDEFLATMPSNFFKSEHIKRDSPDFSVMKMIFYATNVVIWMNVFF